MEKETIWWIVGILVVLALVVGYLVFGNLPGKEEQPLIGGCAGVALDQVQECCERWAAENEIVHVMCVGEWVVVDNRCGWECG